MVAEEGRTRGYSGRKWPVQGGCNHLGFRYIEGHRYNTQPPCVFHPSPSGPSHVLLTILSKKRVFHSSASAKQGPKISGPLAIPFPSLFFFPRQFLFHFLFKRFFRLPLLSSFLLWESIPFCFSILGEFCCYVFWWMMINNHRWIIWSLNLGLD